MATPLSPQHHWRLNLRWIAFGLVLGAGVTVGLCYFARDLEAWSPGSGFAFWLTGQTALWIYGLIVAVYAVVMNHLDDRLSASLAQAADHP